MSKNVNNDVSKDPPIPEAIFSPKDKREACCEGKIAFPFAT